MKCSKCDSDRLAVRYCDGSYWGRLHCGCRRPEHLHWGCLVCRYTWTTACLDKGYRGVSTQIVVIEG